MILPGAMWAVVTLLLLLLLAADPDTHRGVCEEGGLPRGGANEQVLRLQLAASSRTSRRRTFYSEKKEEEGVAGEKVSLRQAEPSNNIPTSSLSSAVSGCRYLMGPMKEVVQGLGVTVEMEEGNRLQNDHSDSRT